MRASNVMSGATMWEFCSCHFKNEEPRLNVNVNVKNNQNFKIRTNFLLVDIKILIDVNKKVQKLISATCCLFQESIIMWTQFYPHSNTVTRGWGHSRQIWDASFPFKWALAAAWFVWNWKLAKLTWVPLSNGFFNSIAQWARMHLPVNILLECGNPRNISYLNILWMEIIKGLVSSF